MPRLRTAGSRDRVLSVLEQTRKRYRFVVVGDAIMPEHIHLVLSEPEVGKAGRVRVNEGGAEISFRDRAG
jgi:putative transposase